jgi:hypothetical protein
MTRLFRFLSLSLVFLAWSLFASRASADPIRILIAASHSEGREGERALKHSASDAEHVRDVFTRLGHVAPEHALLLSRPSADEMLHAIDRAAHLAAGHRRDDVSVLFYFSGHGDQDAIHLGQERLPIGVIEARLATIDAGLRLLVIDACRTNDGRAKGFRETAPFAVVVPEADSAKGTVRLLASADGEAAQESDELNGAVFTHFWVNGLEGAADANSDGQITFGESYAYAYQQTLWRSLVSSGVAQRPAAQVAMEESAPLVLTRTTGASALRFPIAADTHYVVFGIGSQTVVGDLWGSADHATVLAVPPGGYIVHRRGYGSSSAAEVTLAQGETRDVAGADFRPFSEEALVQKGGTVVVYPHELTLGYGLYGTSGMVSLGQRLDLDVARTWGDWALVGGAHGGTGSFDTSYWNTSTKELGLELRIERRFPFGPLMLRAGGGVVGDYVVQSLVRTDAAALAGSPYATTDTRRVLLAGGRADLGLRVPLSRRLWIDADVSLDVLGTEREGSMTALFRGVGRAAFGWRF